MVTLNRIDTEKYRRMQENKRNERQAKKILRELGIQTATNPVSSPYSTDWKFDDGTDNPEDYRGQPVFGTEEGGQTFFEFPFVQKENVKDLFIAQNTNEATGGKLGKHAKDNIKRPEFEADVLEALTEGNVTMQNATEMLQVTEDELRELMDTYIEREALMDTLRIGDEETWRRRQKNKLEGRY